MKRRTKKKKKKKKKKDKTTHLVYQTICLSSFIFFAHQSVGVWIWCSEKATIPYYFWTFTVLFPCRLLFFFSFSHFFLTSHVRYHTQVHGVYRTAVSPYHRTAKEGGKHSLASRYPCQIHIYTRMSKQLKDNVQCTTWVRLRKHLHAHVKCTCTWNDTALSFQRPRTTA